jgi:glycosyltransferase involved in cell wall biosynthesis
LTAPPLRPGEGVGGEAPVRFLAAGSGKDERGIRRAIDRAGLADTFTLLGWRDDVADLYCAADLFVFASHREGLPVAPIEAMASGLPVIASDLPGCCEEIEHEQSGLLYPVGDAEALTDAIRRLLSSPDLAARLAERARTRAAAFSLDEALDRQMALYAGLD